MGGVPSTPRFADSRPQDTAEYLIATFVGEKSFPLASDFWQKLLELPLSLHWPSHRVHQACEAFAQNNCYTRHLAKILIHLTWCLQECISSSGTASVAIMKAINAVYISSVFLKYLIENAESENFEELHLSLDESEPLPKEFVLDQNIENLVMHSVLSFIALVDVSPHTYNLHQELLNFMLVAMSTQLLSVPSLGPKDVHPFIDAAMTEESSLVCSVVRRLLLNYITRPRISVNSSSYSIFSEENQPGVLQRVGSAAATIVLLPFNYLVSSNGEGSSNPLTDCSLLVLLVLIHYHKCVENDESITDRSDDSATSDSLAKSSTHFTVNPYCNALENARDIEFGHMDLEGNAHSGPVVRLPFASLFDTLGMYLADETAVLLLYSLVQGNSGFLEYVLVRTDLDTLILPSVPWYKEHLLHQTSLGSLLVIILIRTVKYNLSKLRDVYLHTTCLATLANMAPHVHRLSAYASQRLVSLFYMLSRKYNKIADRRDDKKGNLTEQDSFAEDMSAELHIYTDFLRIVLEILNAILTYALPRNPEVVYAILHREEVFQPFKSHPRFNELLENIYTVLDFFNSRLDAQRVDGEWSVEKVLQSIIINCRSWRGDGLKMFTRLYFSYEQESHPEEFFIPYVWQLVLSRCGFSFNPSAINLFPVDLPVKVSVVISSESVMEESNDDGEPNKHQNGELNEQRVNIDP
ncbi:Dymeclin [Citrus sinensis]|uniref:Dymeclin n=1 Tax=Citrus sinensis TaxID=2711 RepID=A0ACB8I5S4_CITSI|nr:Dymeclin [Citrus sinensis]